MRIVPVELGENSYDIFIDKELGDEIIDFCTKRNFSERALIITDTNVGPLYGDLLKSDLKKAGLDASVVAIAAGESSKSLTSYEKVITACIERGLDRKSPVFALGGGVVGDLAGFVAASYMRGVPFIQVPTSLLAQVDSSVGGKVAVNHSLGKNLIGAFYQPQAVFMSLNWLDSLPVREIYTGLGEIIKYGIIYDQDFFSYLEENSDSILKLDKTTADHIIARSCEIKAQVVAQDEKESGLRAILNYGHTMGHAVEKNTGYTRYNHGEAVAIGMVCAAHISLQLGLIKRDVFDRVEALIRKFQLPVYAEGCDIDTLYEAIFHDKKTVNGKVNWVLMDGQPGRVRITGDVPGDVVKEAMKYCITKKI
ncbi:MAG: 3-dehydroquinate synthase [Anaerovibrio sp.]|uniref:3-dehydroquinate synthase n=1 Tax=Anaerovibrio sp. TaxID=1872532 RepID=UPI0025E65D2C|nr:3-dehydroquinate synthase [Anaerovibrio sp.]MCR5176054.1 3-dehydroquinate synthase [Anaerovibrio sp.]